MRRVWPAGRGMTYARLERGGLQWPCPDETHPGTARLHDGAFAAGQRATLRAGDPSLHPDITPGEGGVWGVVTYCIKRLP